MFWLKDTALFVRNAKAESSRKQTKYAILISYDADILMNATAKKIRYEDETHHKLSRMYQRCLQ